MKIYLLSFFSCFFALAVNAQDFHLNLYLGVSNYQGDLQDKRFTFQQSHLAGGAGITYDLNDHFSLRTALILGKVSGDDKLGRNKQRNLNFNSAITEGHLGIQYYITPMLQYSLTPYVFAGISLYHFDPYTRDTAGKKYYLKAMSTEGQGFVAGKDYYNLTQFGIPFGGGVKLSLTDNMNVGLEIGLRKLFTDYLDDVSTHFVDENLLLANRGAKAVELAYRGDELKNGSSVYPEAGSQRGSPSVKDWYYFTTLTLSIRLGSRNGVRNSQLDCPENVL